MVHLPPESPETGLVISPLEGLPWEDPGPLDYMDALAAQIRGGEALQAATSPQAAVAASPLAPAQVACAPPPAPEASRHPAVLAPAPEASRHPAVHPAQTE